MEKAARDLVEVALAALLQNAFILL